MMKKYTLKPFTVEAIQWDGIPETLIVLAVMCGATGGDQPPYHILIETIEGKMRVDIGDWIIKGVNGEFYLCKPDIFEATYTEAE